MSRVLNYSPVVVGGLVAIVRATGPKVRKFKPGRGRQSFKDDKNPQDDFLRREVKPSVPCRKIFRHVKRFLRSMTEILRRQNSRTFLANFLPTSLLRVSAAKKCLWWMNEEWSELRWGRTIDQEMAAVRGTVYTIPPRNSYSKSAK
jgi:hypothetical protein